MVTWTVAFEVPCLQFEFNGLAYVSLTEYILTDSKIDVDHAANPSVPSVPFIQLMSVIGKYFLWGSSI
jgi:hypothetical protein